MRYRTLGTTGLKVSVIGLGTWQFGGEWGHSFSQPEVDAILDEAAGQGINLIDTAECYGDHLAESLIGDYLTRHERSRWIVATKFGHKFHSFMNRTEDFSADGVRQGDLHPPGSETLADVLSARTTEWPGSAGAGAPGERSAKRELPARSQFSGW